MSETPCAFARDASPRRNAIPLRSRTSQDVNVLALATVLLAHVRLFAGVRPVRRKPVICLPWQVPFGVYAY